MMYKIKSNKELYGDFELIPLPIEPVQQRIDFFDGKLGKLLKVHYLEQDSEAIEATIKHKTFWEGIKEYHC